MDSSTSERLTARRPLTRGSRAGYSAAMPRCQYLHTMVRVRDLDAALRFFCDGLGLREVRRTNHNHFLDTWSFSFSRDVPCRPIAFRHLSLKRHASRSPSLRGHYPLPRYYGLLRLLPSVSRRQVSQVPVLYFPNAPCPYTPSRRACRVMVSARPCWLRLS